MLLEDTWHIKAMGAMLVFSMMPVDPNNISANNKKVSVLGQIMAGEGTPPGESKLWISRY